MSNLVETMLGSLDGKRRWREHRRRVSRLPEGHRTAMEGLERYVLHRGAIADGDVLVTALQELATRFEDAAARGASVRDVVGEDPLRFVETFLAGRSEGGRFDGERARLRSTIGRAETLDGSADA